MGPSDDRASVRVEVGWALARLVGQFGPSVLDSPERLRGLLNDELGVDAAGARSDVNLVVSAVRAGAHRPARHGDLEAAAAMVSDADPGGSREDARWSAELLAWIWGANASVEPTVLPVPEPATPRPASARGAWPMSAKVAVAIAAVLVPLIGLAGFAVGSSRDGGDAAAAPADRDSTPDEPSADDDGELRQERDEARAEAEGLRAQVETLQQGLATAEAEAAAAAARADAASAAFPAELAALQTADPSGSYRITGTRLTCSYGNCAETSSELSKSGYIEPTGTGWQLVIPGYVSMPLGWNGWVLTGSAPTTSTGTCSESGSDVTLGEDAGIRVTVAAVDVNDAGQVTAQRLAGTWEDYIPSGGGCREASSTYDVVLTRD